MNEEPNGSMTDNDYSFIHKDIFDIIQYTHQNNNIPLKIISNKPTSKYSQYKATYSSVENICKKSRIFINTSPCQSLQIQRQKK